MTKKEIKTELKLISEKIEDAKKRREFITMANLVYEYKKLEKELENG